MSNQIIIRELISTEDLTSIYPKNSDTFVISEMFSDTVQGEGVTIGVPATFIRFTGCTLKCVWCDTLQVWNEGIIKTHTQVMDYFKQNNLIDRIKNGQRIIFTGGSPFKQMKSIYFFLIKFRHEFGFSPYIEFENECVLYPYEISLLMRHHPSSRIQWNNSPKLENSNMKAVARYKPDVIRKTAELPNSWFKFVVDSQSDWVEIERDFIEPGLVSKDQIILMPKGENRQELEKNRPIAVELAVANSVRFSDRLHITLWDKKTGV